MSDVRFGMYVVRRRICDLKVGDVMVTDLGVTYVVRSVTYSKQRRGWWRVVADNTGNLYRGTTRTVPIPQLFHTYRGVQYWIVTGEQHGQ